MIFGVFEVSRTIEPAQWAAYLRAGIRIDLGSRVVQVRPDPSGATHGDFPKVLGRTIHIITAANPYGQLATDEDNDRFHRDLQRELRRFSLDATWPAAGGDVDGTHSERSVAVVGLTDVQAREIGQRFSQDAIFAWTPRWLTLMSCVSHEASVRGWRATV